MKVKTIVEREAHICVAVRDLFYEVPILLDNGDDEETFNEFMNHLYADLRVILTEERMMKALDDGREISIVIYKEEQ